MGKAGLVSRWRSPQLSHENRRLSQISVVLAPSTGRSLILTRRVSWTLDVLPPHNGQVTNECTSETTVSSRSVSSTTTSTTRMSLQFEAHRHRVGNQGSSSFSRLLDTTERGGASASQPDFTRPIGSSPNVFAWTKV